MDNWGKLSGPVQLDLGADITTKAGIRTKVWDFLEKNDLANFPRPVHNRIPNFKGSAAAGLAVTELPEFRRAQTIKVNPDKAQEEVRYQVLDHRKTLLVPTPRLTKGLFNKLLHPGQPDKELLRKLSSRQGLAEDSVPVSLDTRLKIDLVVLGSVAVDRLGHRIGKGEGFADLEFAVAASHHQAVHQDTIVVSTVHDCQVFDSLPAEIFEAHDVPIDIIVTPTQVIRVSNRLPKPLNIFWSMISKEKFKKIGLLKEIRLKEKQDGVDVALKDEKEGVIGVGGNVEDTNNTTVNENGKAKMKKNKPKLRNKSRIDDKEEIHLKLDNIQSESENMMEVKSKKLDKRKYEKLDRSKMSGVFIGQMAKSTRVRDLKNALSEKQVFPAELVWKGHKGIAFVYFHEGAEEIISKLTGLTVREKLVNVEQVRIIKKEGEQVEPKNNNVKNGRRIQSVDDNGKCEISVNQAGDGKNENNLEDNGRKIEKYSSKRGKRKSTEKSPVMLKVETIEKQIVQVNKVEMKGDGILDNKVDSIKPVSNDSMLEDDASKGIKEVSIETENMLDCDDSTKTETILKEETKENEILLKDEISAKEENENLLTSDTDNNIEKNNKNETDLTDIANEIKLENENSDNVDPIDDVDNEIASNQLEVSPTICASKENEDAPNVEKESSKCIKISQEKSDNLNEEKPVESATVVMGHTKEKLIKKSKLEDKPKSVTEKIKLEFKPKAEEKLKSETLTEKAKEKMEAKLKVEEIPKCVVDKQIQSKPNMAEDLQDNESKSIAVKPKEKIEHKQGAEVKFAAEMPKEKIKGKLNAEEKQTSYKEKKVRVKSKSSEVSKDKMEGNSKNEMSKSGAEKSKEKVDAKPIAEERPKSVTEVTKEKEGNKSKLEDRQKIEGKSKTIDKNEMPSASLKMAASKESSSSKSSSEESKKSSPKEASSSGASNSPGIKPESPNVPIDSEKDPEKCIIS